MNKQNQTTGKPPPPKPIISASHEISGHKDLYRSSLPAHGRRTGTLSEQRVVAEGERITRPPVMKILVIDGNATNRKSLRVLLTQEGHTVLEALRIVVRPGNTRTSARQSKGKV